MFSIFFFIISYLFIINLESIKPKSNSLSDTQKQNNNKPSSNINSNITCEKCLEKKIYLPEYQNKYSRINELNDSNFNFLKITNNRSVALVPDDLIEANEKHLEMEKIAKIINKIEKNY